MGVSRETKGLRDKLVGSDDMNDDDDDDGLWRVVY